MKHLYLMRHAKSDWDDFGLSDHQRPLNKRGRKASKTMAKYIAENLPAIDVVLCSTAARTRETLSPIAKAMHARGQDVQFIYRDDLYHASADTILETVNSVAESYQTCLVLGHNPGMEIAADKLCKEQAGEHWHKLHMKYVTGSLAVFSLGEKAWCDLDWKQGDLLNYITPKSLPADED